MLRHCARVLAQVGVVTVQQAGVAEDVGRLVDARLCALEGSWAEPTAATARASTGGLQQSGAASSGRGEDVFTPAAVRSSDHSRLGAAHVAAVAAGSGAGSTSGPGANEEARSWVLTPHEGLKPDAKAADFERRRKARLAALASVAGHLGAFGGADVQPSGHSASPTVLPFVTPAATSSSAPISAASGTAGRTLARMPSLSAASLMGSAMATASSSAVNSASTPAPVLSVSGPTAAAAAAGGITSGAADGGTAASALPVQPARAPFPTHSAMGSRWEGVMYDIG